MNKKSGNPFSWTRIFFKASIGLFFAFGCCLLLPVFLYNKNISSINCKDKSFNAEFQIDNKFKSKIYKYLVLDPIIPPTGSFLTSIAIPRVSGSEGNSIVRSFIRSKFSFEYWDIEEDVHVIDSLHGPSTSFINLIFTFKNNVKSNRSGNSKSNNNYNEQKRTILAAHYDSKLLEAETESQNIAVSTLKSDFIGASDSAWSCALLIAIAQAITLEQEKREIEEDFSKRQTINLQIIFFDGEEAVKHWSPTDSLYGSRGLAHKWSQYPLTHPNSLTNISALILLDLLGTSDGKDIYSFHPNGTKMAALFEQLMAIEKGKNLTRLEDNMKSDRQSDFSLFKTSDQFKHFNGQAIEDDHTPFLVHNVPILHLIPIPFPKVWHTPQDTLHALDPDVCEHLAIVIYEFIRQRFF